MKHIAARNWEDYNRSERIEKILTSLNRSGQAEAEFFRGRPYIARVFLGRGTPRLVNEEDEWNQIRIHYQGKDALEISYSGIGYEGYFFDENFTETENKEILTAIAEGDVFTWEAQVSSRRKLMKLLIAIGLPLGLVCFIGFSLEGDVRNATLSLSMVICFFLYYYLAVIRK